MSTPRSSIIVAAVCRMAWTRAAPTPASQDVLELAPVLARVDGRSVLLAEHEVGLPPSGCRVLRHACPRRFTRSSLLPSRVLAQRLDDRTPGSPITRGVGSSLPRLRPAQHQAAADASSGTTRRAGCSPVGTAPGSPAPVRCFGQRPRFDLSAVAGHGFVRCRLLPPGRWSRRSGAGRRSRAATAAAAAASRSPQCRRRGRSPASTAPAPRPAGGRSRCRSATGARYAGVHHLDDRVRRLSWTAACASAGPPRRVDHLRRRCGAPCRAAGRRPGRAGGWRGPGACAPRPCRALRIAL
jgi:hypothetical protein